MNFRSTAITAVNPKSEKPDLDETETIGSHQSWQCRFNLYRLIWEGHYQYVEGIEHDYLKGRHPETVPLSLGCAVPACRTWRRKRQRRSAPERAGPACTAHPGLIKSDFAVEELARTESWRLSRIGKGESKRFIIPFESF
ncbi:hypothetical protein BT93_H2698 [Corymbia citriodora subsp. variegata]|nr:hypothetical protein BT93_H2698 [Corymbia citriodora subsp. variegata]